MKHYELGKIGESIANKYLIKKGYKVLETNWRSKGYEVDIIAVKNRTIIVAEVKTRSSVKFQQPYNAVDRNKQRSIIKVAESYIFKNRLDLEVRFDIISVVINSNTFRIKHIKNAFIPLIK